MKTVVLLAKQLNKDLRVLFLNFIQFAAKLLFLLGCISFFLQMLFWTWLQLYYPTMVDATLQQEKGILSLLTGFVISTTGMVAGIGLKIFYGNHKKSVSGD